MARNGLEELVSNTHRQINQRESELGRRAGGSEGTRLPRISVALGIWLLVVVGVAWQYPKLQTWFFAPSDTVVEQDLERILAKAALSLEERRHETGDLPSLLPNPALRSLIAYETDGLGGYTLRASIGDVVMEYPSRLGHAHRVR